MTPDQLTLLAGPGQHHGIQSHDTEVAAAASDRTTLRERVLEVYRNAGPRGLSDYEASVRAGIARPHSAGTRREELIRRGYRIVDSGQRRPTDSGRMAIVWVLGEDK